MRPITLHRAGRLAEKGLQMNSFNKQRKRKRFRIAGLATAAVLALGSAVSGAPLATAAPVVAEGIWCEYETCWSNVETYRATDTFYWVHEASGAKIKVTLHTELRGRRPWYSIRIDHESGPGVIVDNIHIQCKQDKNNWFDLGCGHFDAGESTVTDHFFFRSQTLGPIAGNWLVNGAEYHAVVNATLDTVGGEPENKTLARSSDFDCHGEVAEYDDNAIMNGVTDCRF